MTPSEFKSWFEGFTEAMNDVPSKKQWARIRERVAEIDGKPVTERVFVDRYWPYPYYPYTSSGIRWTTPVCTTPICYGSNSLGSVSSVTFDSNTAMYASGKADALSIGGYSG